MANQPSTVGKSTNSTITDLDSQAPTTQQVAASPDLASEEVKGSNFDAELAGGKVNLMIMAGQEDGGNDAVNIGLNGYTYQVPRNVTCLVPVEVAEIIQNAVVTRYLPNARGIPEERAAPRFAYTLMPATA
jgi:hypothetical protein